MAGERRILSLADAGIAEVPVVGRYAYASVRPGLDTHSHPGAMEFVYLHRGCQTYRVGGRSYRLHGGDVFITRPDEPHDTGGEPEERAVLYWLNLVVLPRKRGFLMLPGREGDLLKEQLLAIPHRHLPGSPLLKTLLDEIFALHEDPHDPLTRLAMQNRVVRWLLEILACVRRMSATGYSGIVADAIHNIEQNPRVRYPVREMAGRTDLSVSRFKAVFRAETGMGPHEYALRAKVDAARQLLKEPGASITAVAYELGFSSSQYFATVFKRFTTLTPREYQRVQPVRLRPGQDLYPDREES
jgi:AraC-like DNA-binding protein